MPKGRLKLEASSLLIGSKVPAAISSLRNSRTSWRSAWHSGGRRMGSNCRTEAVISVIPFARATPDQMGPFGLGKLLAISRSAYREATNGQSASAPFRATLSPKRTAQTLSLPKSSRQAHSRWVKRCNTCSCVKPMAPWAW